jgi:helix-turn-helix protein
LRLIARAGHPRAAEDVAGLQPGGSLLFVELPVVITVDIDAVAAAIAARLEPDAANVWMTAPETWEYMRVSRSWLYTHLWQIPHHKVEGRLLFNRKEIDSWISDHGKGG